MGLSDAAAATSVVAVLMLLLGILLGALVTQLRASRREGELLREKAALEVSLAAAGDQAAERSRMLDTVEQRFATLTGRLAQDALQRNSEAFLNLATQRLGRQQELAASALAQREQAVAALVSPIATALEQTRQQLREMEQLRAEAFGGIRAQLGAMQSAQQSLQQETRNLATALRRPEVRGRWGEVTLRRIAELAGMVEHCDFSEQASTADGSQRPDLLVHLPRGGVLVIDVKTPLDAYLESIEAVDPDARKSALQRHTRNLQQRVRELAAKAYWAGLPESPEMVILFVPGEQFLAAALDQNPALLEHAMAQKVVLTTPSSLMALLTTVAHGWRQLALAENAEQIRTLGEELYNRLATFCAHLGRLGRQLEGSVNAYNQSVGSLERMVLPGARKLAELGVRGNQPVETPAPLEATPRSPVAPGTDTDDQEGSSS